MMDGVSMRLLVMVWNITVEAAMAVPTSTMPSTLRPRKGMMKLHEPRASSVMKSTTTPMASSAKMMRLAWGAKRPQRRLRGRAGWVTLADTRGPPQQHEEEDGAAHEAYDGADGDLEGVAQRAPQDVAGQHEAGAEDGQPRDGTAHVVAYQQADHVGHHQADEGDGAHGHHVHGRDERDDGEPQRHDAPVVDAQVLGERLAHAGHGEAVGGHVGQQREAARQPQQLVAPAQHAREVAVGPGGQGLQEVVAVGQEGGESGEDPAQHEAQ